MTISVIVYGRNDSYGYNMHKRVAISLNCIAEVLTDPEDEILYVDYNTSDNLPSIIEAISDTLTDKAKKLVRVLRVRSDVHDKFKNLTHAQVNEALARNIGVRRSNPKNKWILSTNTDMVFTILENGKSLSDIAKESKDGFYELARFDVPESMWEALDRKDPHKIISLFKDWGKSLHLNEVVYGNDVIIYDAPGDFQLMMRDDIFAIHGFDENMIWGWHVDSNLCKRMFLLRGKLGSLQDKIYGYHCNHTRHGGWQHLTSRKNENCIKRFFEDVASPYLENQKDSWGLGGQEIEEFRLGDDPTLNFTNRLQQITTKPLSTEFTESHYCDKGFDDVLYSTNHIAPYLLEQISLSRKGSCIVYIGYNPFMLEKLEKFCTLMNNDLDLYYYQYFPPKGNKHYRSFLKHKLNPKTAIPIELKNINEKTDLLILDFGFEKNSLAGQQTEKEALQNILNGQDLLVRSLASEVSGKRFKAISIGAHNTRYYKTVKKSFNPIQNPFNGHILVGHKINTLKNLKERFYFEYLASNINSLTRKKGALMCLFLLPFYSSILATTGILTYKAKSLALRRRVIRSKLKLRNYYL